MALMDFKLGDVGDVFRAIRESITGEKISDPQKLLEDLGKIELAFLETKGKVIEAEASSEHFLTATWRPITMLTFTFIVANNYIIAPYFSALFGIDIPTLTLTEDMWDLLTVGLGGYVVGRSAEKFAKEWKR